MAAELCLDICCIYRVLPVNQRTKEA